jgi:hypothetical protein
MPFSLWPNSDEGEHGCGPVNAGRSVCRPRVDDLDGGVGEVVNAAGGEHRSVTPTRGSDLGISGADRTTESLAENHVGETAVDRAVGGIGTEPGTHLLRTSRVDHFAICVSTPRQRSQAIIGVRAYLVKKPLMSAMRWVPLSV